MGMKYIRDCYKVPAKVGGRVRYLGSALGTILGARGPHLRIKLDGNKHASLFHPMYRLEYLETTAPAEAKAKDTL